jgi:hypothetical protein
MRDEKLERSSRPVSAIMKRFRALAALQIKGTELNQLMSQILTGQAEVWDSWTTDQSIDACPLRLERP